MRCVCSNEGFCTAERDTIRRMSRGEGEDAPDIAYAGHFVKGDSRAPTVDELLGFGFDSRPDSHNLAVSVIT